MFFSAELVVFTVFGLLRTVGCGARVPGQTAQSNDLVSDIWTAPQKPTSHVNDPGLEIRGIRGSAHASDVSHPIREPMPVRRKTILDDICKEGDGVHPCHFSLRLV